MTTVTDTAAPSPRTDRAGAGWEPTPAGSWRDLMDGLPPLRRRSWFNPNVLWICRNDVLAKFCDPVPFIRSQWVRGRAAAELTVDLTDRLTGDFSFLLMGDTGEGDNSQFAVVPPLVHESPDTAFLLLCSDVLYPLGDVNDYERKFYRPYAGYPGPVYGLPGNHDWYDGLTSFMYHLCGVEEPLSRATWRSDLGAHGRAWWRAALRRPLWRHPRPADTARIAEVSAQRGRPAQRQPARQPGPYYVIDTALVRVVCIDTGILGDLDEAQAAWLVEVSRDPRPKLLLTGKPLLVDGDVHPCRLAGSPDGFGSVLQVVHHAPFGYLGSIGGDIHNYQRYPVRLPGRTVQHVVSGGGGAFMHATHLIGELSRSPVAAYYGVTEDDLKLYPWRRDSLAAYSLVLQRKLRRLRLPVDVTLTDEQAAAIVNPRAGVVTGTDRPAAAPGEVTRGNRLAAAVLLRFGGRRFHQWFSPFFDWDDPPFFKHFLRLDVRGDAARGEIEVTCFGVTGRAEHEQDVPVADTFVMAWGSAQL